MKLTEQTKQFIEKWGTQPHCYNVLESDELVSELHELIQTACQEQKTECRNFLFNDLPLKHLMKIKAAPMPETGLEPKEEKQK